MTGCRVRVLRWWDVLDGEVWQAVCPGCRWSGDVRHAEVSARIDVQAHRDRGVAS